MNTSGNRINSLVRFLAVTLIVSVVSLVQLSRPTSSNAVVQERIMESGVREHVPIKFKIKKEKEQSFKDLKNAKWVSDFELEVTNTGDKPIYYLYLDLITDVKSGTSPLVFALQYGKAELGDLTSKAQSDDRPILPKESCMLKFHPGQIPAWERVLLKEFIQMLRGFMSRRRGSVLVTGLATWRTLLIRLPLDRVHYNKGNLKLRLHSPFYS